MIPTQKLLWGEGLFLRPQHFQRQDAYHEGRLAKTARALHPYAWGVQSLKVDTDALQSGMVRLLEAQLVFPDGEILQAPGEDELPPPLALSSLPDVNTEVVLHLALAPLRTSGSNFAASLDEADTAVRYVQHQQSAPDLFTGAVDSEVTVLRKSVRLLADHQPRDHLVSVPVLRLRRTSTGGFELDGRFVPPCLSIHASPALTLRLRRLLDALEAKVEALYGFHREPSKNIIEFRSGDVASFWLLHTASAAFAELSHYFRHPGLHPERLYQSLLSLAGALLTFSKSYRLADLPAYDHGSPTAAFNKLDDIVRDLLETVISTRYFAIALGEIKPAYHQGRLDSQQIDGNTSLYVGVSGSLPPAELVDMVPLRFKLGAPDDVDKLVLSAMPGVRLIHQPQVPPAIPVRPGTYYFLIEPRGQLYERMLAAQAITLYTPGSIGDLKLELLAVNP